MTPLSSLLPTIDVHWCIEPRYAAAALMELETVDLAMHRALFAARQLRTSDEEDAPAYAMRGSTALFSVCGPLTKRQASWGDGASTEKLIKSLDAGAADGAVANAVMVFDTPGGQVSGISDAADAIDRFKAKKPIVGYAQDLCCSAGLWLMVKCSRAAANRTALIGSIGVRTEVSDLSAMYAMAGVKKHAIATGEFKGAGTSGTPITASQLANWQREVEEINAEFMQAVAAGRGLDMEAVQALADGRVHIAASAMALGLIDSIESLDDVVANLQASSAKSKYVGGW